MGRKFMLSVATTGALVALSIWALPKAKNMVRNIVSDAEQGMKDMQKDIQKMSK